jgi:hypothetical protein
MSAEHQDENVGAAGDRQGDGGGIEKSDEKNTSESEVEDPGRDQATMGRAGGCFRGEDHGG